MQGLVHLAKLPTLSGLNLGKTRITDAGLKHLAGLKALTDLNLAETRVTDAGLKHLAGLSSLRQLIVKGGGHRRRDRLAASRSPDCGSAEPPRIGANR